jgi:hypothetical protein
MSDYIKFHFNCIPHGFNYSDCLITRSCKLMQQALNILSELCSCSFCKMDTNMKINDHVCMHSCNSFCSIKCAEKSCIAYVQHYSIIQCSMYVCTYECTGMYICTCINRVRKCRSSAQLQNVAEATASPCTHWCWICVSYCCHARISGRFSRFHCWRVHSLTL